MILYRKVVYMFVYIYFYILFCFVYFLMKQILTIAYGKVYNLLFHRTKQIKRTLNTLKVFILFFIKILKMK